MRILVCDDSAFMRTMLASTISKTTHEVAGEAENGKQAVAKYKELRPDLVTMDITMPEMDGLEALKLIREFDPNAKVVMCSAMGQQAMVINSIKSGAKDFLVKPIQNEKLLETLGKFE